MSAQISAVAAVVLPMPISPMPASVTPSAASARATSAPTASAASASARVSAGSTRRLPVPRRTARRCKGTTGESGTAERLPATPASTSASRTPCRAARTETAAPPAITLATIPAVTDDG